MAYIIAYRSYIDLKKAPKHLTHTIQEFLQIKIRKKIFKIPVFKSQKNKLLPYSQFNLHKEKIMTKTEKFGP